MGLFTRRRSGRPSSGHAGDDQVLAQLEAMGADLSRSRLWEHFVYCDDEEGAAQLEAEAADAGWDVKRVAPGNHGIVASRRDLVVDHETVATARQFFESAAASVPGGDYDGWGAEGD